MVHLARLCHQGLRFLGVFCSVIFSLWLLSSWSRLVLVPPDFTCGFQAERGKKWEGVPLNQKVDSFLEILADMSLVMPREIFLVGNIATLNKIRLLGNKKKWRRDYVGSQKKGKWIPYRQLTMFTIHMYIVLRSQADLPRFKMKDCNTESQLLDVLEPISFNSFNLPI